jgi:hypothetical protein
MKMCSMCSKENVKYDAKDKSVQFFFYLNKILENNTTQSKSEVSA